MAFYLDEEEVWKCPKHPSKRRRTGICPVCLRERLASLCPDCAHARPCACIATTRTTSSSSSSSSSFSRFSSGVGSVGRVSNLIENEPSFRRSRSVAVPFLRSKSKFGGETRNSHGDCGDSPSWAKTPSFWSFLKANRSKRSDDGNERVEEKVKIEEERKIMMRKSRSVAVTSGIGGGDVRPSKGRSWYFPSPIKVFRQYRISKVVVHQRSPLYRG